MNEDNAQQTSGSEEVAFARIAAGAVLGTAFGAGAWALAGAYVSFSPAWLAWAVGVAAGVVTSLFGGRGRAAATVCALIAVFGLLLGKPVLAELRHRMQVDALFAAQLSEAEYARFGAMADAWAAGVSDAELAAFLIRHGLTPAAAPEDVDAEELDRFRDQFAPALREFIETRPSYTEWRDRIIRNVGPVIEEIRRARGSRSGRLRAGELLIGALGIALGFAYVALPERRAI